MPFLPTPNSEEPVFWTVSAIYAATALYLTALIRGGGGPGNGGIKARLASALTRCRGRYPSRSCSNLRGWVGTQPATRLTTPTTGCHPKGDFVKGPTLIQRGSWGQIHVAP